MRIDFYIIEKESPDAAYQVAAKLIEKAHQQELTTWVLCDTQESAEKLDDWLWTYDDTSFLPHAIASELPMDEQPPIQIGLSLPEAGQAFDILVNLSEAMPETYNKFRRVLELVPAHAKEAGRMRYKAYRDQNCELHRHMV